MRHVITHILLIIFSVCPLFAATPVPGGTIDGQIWNKAGSPYIVGGNLVIVSLIIEAGVTVQFNDNHHVRVDGLIQAVGFYSDSIYFQTSSNNPDGWQGIEFEAGAGFSVLDYCRIDDIREYGIRINNSTPQINHCKISGSQDVGIFIRAAEIEFKNCQISGSGYAGIVLDTASVTLRNVIIDHNQGGGILSTNEQDNLSLINSVVVDNAAFGIDCQGSALSVRNSIISGNGTEIIWTNPQPLVSYSSISGASVWPGEGNINTDPGFAETVYYRLSADSDCIDRGDSTTAVFNDLYFPPSLGTARNDIGAYGGPEAGGWYPPVYVVPEITDFGAVPVDSSVTLQATAINYRNTVINVTEIVFRDSTQIFSVSPESFFLAPLDEQLLDLSFQPNTRSESVDTMMLNTNQSGSIYYPLRGHGVAAEIHLSTPELAFDNVFLGDSSILAFAIHNRGSDTLRISSIISSGDAFQVSQTSLFVLPGGSSDSIEVKFSPTDPMFYQDSLIINSNDPQNRIIKIDLSGNGRGPLIQTMPALLSFGPVDVLSDSIMYLAIRNQGNEILSVEDIRFLGQVQKNFSLVDTAMNYPLDLKADSSLIIPIRFRPRQTGIMNAQLAIYSNDPFMNSKIVELIGIGYGSKILISADSINFGQIPFGTDSTVILTVVNNGTAQLVLNGNEMIISGEDSASFTILNSEGTHIIPVDSCKLFQVHYAPQTTGPVTAILNLSSNDPLNPEKHISLCGIAFDPQPASVSIDQANFTKPLVKGNAATFSFVINSNTQVDSAFLFFRRGGEAIYQTYKLSLFENDKWQVQLEPHQISERGVEFYVQVSHGYRLTRFPGDSLISYSLQVDVEQLIFPTPTEQEQYQMISVPLELKGQSLSELFFDDLGSYDVTRYRFFDCQNGSDYTELTSLSDSLEAGKALWLITKDSVRLDISNARSVNTDKSYEIQLKQGWNMIATPYAFAVDWSEINDISDLRSYENGEWGFASVMMPFRGYAIKSTETRKIHIPAKERKDYLKKPRQQTLPVRAEWQFQLSAQSSGVRDRFNYAGVFSEASSDIDRFDLAEPPQIGDYVSLYLILDSEQIPRSTDYRQPGLSGYQFEFKVISNIYAEKNIHVIPHDLPSDLDWVVVSLHNRINYGKELITTDRLTEHFRLIVGDRDFLQEALSDFRQIPDHFALGQNYPNPFNPVTKIDFQLPEKSEVKMNVYNILGQKVRELMNNQKLEAGYYQVRWDGLNKCGRPVASGIYFLKFITKRYSKTIKMIMQR